MIAGEKALVYASFEFYIERFALEITTAECKISDVVC